MNLLRWQNSESKGASYTILKNIRLAVLSGIVIVSALTFWELSSRSNALSVMSNSEARMYRAVNLQVLAYKVAAELEMEGWQRLPYDRRSPVDDPKNLYLMRKEHAPLGSYTLVLTIIPDELGRVTSYQSIKHKSQL